MFVQVAPQPPQLPTSDLVFTSRPLRSLLPLQSAKPVAQVPLQAPLPQVTVSMLLVEQLMPHPPQEVAVVLMFTSQPSVSLLPLQSAKPVVQVPLQTPLPQVVVAMLAVEHTRPQPPQSAAVTLRLASQPLFLLPSQSAKPALHTGEQAPDTQLVVPSAFVQVVPQAPQLVTEPRRVVSAVRLVAVAMGVAGAAHRGADTGDTARGSIRVGTGEAATAAIRDAARRAGFATVVLVAVAIAKAGAAHRDASAERAARGTIGVRAREAAAAAVGDAACGAGFTSVVLVAVAIGEAAAAHRSAQARCTARGAVRVRTSDRAAAAVRGVLVVLVSQPSVSLLSSQSP